MSLSKLKTDPGLVNGSGGDATTLQENDYRRIILQLQNEITSKDTRLKGVHALTLMLHTAEEQCKFTAEKSKNHERLLRRAEARIAQLNKKFGIGPQTAFNRGVVMPGVSRKDFELVTQENMKLKNALIHIEPTTLRGHEVVLRNKELYDLVTSMKDDLSHKDYHIKELESKLRDSGNLAVVPELQQKVMYLEKSLHSKQIFCETLIKEIDTLKSKNEEIMDLEQEDNQESVDGKNTKKEQQQREQENNILKEQTEKLRLESRLLKEKLAEIQGQVEERFEKMTSLETEKSKLSEQVAAQIEKLQQESKQNADLMKEHAESNKKCNAFFQQVVSLNSKQKESEEEAARMKRALDHQKAEVEEKKGMIHLMTESLKSYEDDFRRESEEKAKYQKMVDKAQQDTERVKRENMSHMATIKHLEHEFEKMDKLLKDERQRNNSSYKGFGISRPIAAVGGPRSMFVGGNHRRMEVVADGGGVDESDGRLPDKTVSMPTAKPDPPSLIECPYCSRSYPYHLIEGHVQDCMEDSLYMDDKD